jgi:hypothetical protein
MRKLWKTEEIPRKGYTCRLTEGAAAASSKIEDP